jgi:hypothetical protein
MRRSRPVHREPGIWRPRSGVAEFSEPKAVGRTRFVICRECGAAVILEEGSDPRDKHSHSHEQRGQDRNTEFRQRTRKIQMQVFSKPGWSTWPD